MVLRRPQPHRWRRVPSIRAMAPPAPVACGEELHLIVLDPQRRLAWNRFRPAAGWADWQEIPTPFTPASAPFALAFQGSILLFSLSTDGRLYRAIWAGQGWSDWGALPAAAQPLGASGGALASEVRAVAWQDELLFFWSTHSRSCAWWREGWRSVPEVGPVSAGPHPAVWNDQLHLLLVDDAGDLRHASHPVAAHWSSSEAVSGAPHRALASWSSPQTVPGAPRTTLAPWAVATRSALILAVTSASGRVYLSRQGRLSGWHPWRAISDDGLAAHGPALCAFAGRIYTFAVTVDGTIYHSAIR